MRDGSRMTPSGDSSSSGQDLLGAAKDELDVGEAFGVGPGVLDGGGGVFNGDNSLCVGGEQQGEGAHASIGVDDGLVDGELKALFNQVYHCLQLPYVNLKEGGGGDAEGAAVDGLQVALLAGGYGNISLLESGLDEVIAGVNAPTDGELGGLGTVSLELPQNAVDARVHQEAVVDGYVLAGLAIDETEESRSCRW